MPVDLKKFDTEIRQDGNCARNERESLCRIFETFPETHAEESPKLKQLARNLDIARKSLGSSNERYPKEYFDPKLMCLLADHLTRTSRITFCSIDCEFYEKSPGLITEIGLSIIEIDKKKPLLFPPIRNYHLVRKEQFNQTRNSRYVPDHRGYSTTAVSVTLPMSKSRDHFQEILKYWIDESKAQNGFFVYVGHGVLQDLDVLRKSGYYVPAHYVLDTSILWSYPLQKYQVSLFDVMAEMGLQQRFLHNAVNDANITLQAALNMIDPVFREQNYMWDYMTLLNFQETFTKLDEDFRLFLRTHKLTHKMYKPKFTKSVRSKMGSVDYYQDSPEHIVGKGKVEMFCFKLFHDIGSAEFQRKLKGLKNRGLSDLYRCKTIN